MSELNSAAANEIRAACARARISQESLANLMGVSQAWVSRRASGEVSISLHDLERITSVLGAFEVRRPEITILLGRRDRERVEFGAGQ